MPDAHVYKQLCFCTHELCIMSTFLTVNIVPKLDAD